MALLPRAPMLLHKEHHSSGQTPHPTLLSTYCCPPRQLLALKHQSALSPASTINNPFIATSYLSPFTVAAFSPFKVQNIWYNQPTHTHRPIYYNLCSNLRLFCFIHSIFIEVTPVYLILAPQNSQNAEHKLHHHLFLSFPSDQLLINRQNSPHPLIEATANAYLNCPTILWHF